MGIVDNFMNQTIDRVYSTTTNGFGDVTTTLLYEDIPCRWQEIVGRIPTATDEYREYTVQVWVPTDYTFKVDYRVEKGSETYTVISRETRVDLAGQDDHIKLYLT